MIVADAVVATVSDQLISSQFNNKLSGSAEC